MISSPVSRRSWVFALVFGTLLMAAFGAFNILEDLSVRSWPTVPGVILESHVYPRRRNKSLSLLPPWRIAVRYSYSFADVAYEKDYVRQTSYGAPRFWSESAARAFLSSVYPSGKAVSVYVDPADPNRAALDASLDASTFALVPFVLFLLLLPVFTRVRRKMKAV